MGGPADATDSLRQRCGRGGRRGGAAAPTLPLYALPLTRLMLPCAVQGLLLDLDAATLTVWVNGERKGVMVRPGMTDRHGNPVAPLAGPLCC